MTAALDDEMGELRRANAELRHRLDEGLAREAATAEVLRSLIRRPAISCRFSTQSSGALCDLVSSIALMAGA